MKSIGVHHALRFEMRQETSMRVFTRIATSIATMLAATYRRTPRTGTNHYVSHRLLPAFVVLLLGAATHTFAQWQGDSNTQTFAGNVAIGKNTAPAGKLEVVNPTGGFGNGSYLQVTGSTADNNNLPDIVLKGGNGIGYAISTYPSIKLTDAGYGLALWGASGAIVPNPIVAIVDSGSGSFWVTTAAGTPTAIRAWSSGSVAIGTSALPIAPLDVHAAAQVAGSARRNVASFDTSAAAQGVGGGIAFGGNYSAAGASTPDFANMYGI